MVCWSKLSSFKAFSRSIRLISLPLYIFAHRIVRIAFARNGRIAIVGRVDKVIYLNRKKRQTAVFDIPLCQYDVIFCLSLSILPPIVSRVDMKVLCSVVYFAVTDICLLQLSFMVNICCCVCLSKKDAVHSCGCTKYNLSVSSSLLVSEIFLASSAKSLIISSRSAVQLS